MVKKKSMVTVIIIMLAFVLNSLSFVSALAGVKVNIRIEGYDKTIISKDVYAYNFSDALKALSNNDNIDIQLKTTGADISINSINGVENGFFGGSDKWFSVIEREGQLISENALNSTLKEGDKLVVYYGEFAKTEWLSKLSVESSGGEAKFFAQAQNDEWVMKDGQWTVDGEMRPVENLRINMRMPNGNYKILRTGEDGIAKTALNMTGVYTYKAEKYNSGAVPSAVASEKFYHIYGIEDESAVTRGEAAAFIVNTFGIKAKPVETFFEDVTEETANYKEIMAAFSAGVVSGGGGGNFSPDNKINLMAFCVMLCNGAGIEGEEAAYENVPDWAAKGVAGAVESGLINGIEQEWSGNVTGEMLVTVYKNYIKADR